MPIYDLRCAACGANEEVILLGDEAAPTACSVCGGELRRQLSPFVVIGRGGAGGPAAAKGAGKPGRAKTCGHASACRCAVKLDRPNPFADRLVAPGSAPQ